MPNTARAILMAQFALVIIVGAAIVAWPVHVSVLGTDGNCGPAIVAWVEYTESTNAIEQQCAHEGAQHSLVGGLVAIGGLILLLVVASSMEKHLPWWDGQRWRTGPVVAVPNAPPPAAPPR